MMPALSKGIWLRKCEELDSGETFSLLQAFFLIFYKIFNLIPEEKHAEILIFSLNMKLFFLTVLFAAACSYPETDRIWGIDVSHHQGDINWDLVYKKGALFTYIKATEGGAWKDPKYLENRKKAKKAGLKVGAYHYFSFCKDPKIQLNNLIRTVHLADEDLPMAVDVELRGNCSKKISPKQFRRELKHFLTELENHYHVRPIIYSTMKFYNRHLVKEFSDYRVWIQNLNGEDKALEELPWIFWQYKVGKVSGIKGVVDLNFFNGDHSDFRLIRDKK